MFISSQKIQFINATNGLNIREKPNTNSKKIGKLNHGAIVHIIKETGIDLSNTDSGKVINGECFEVKQTTDHQSCFIFSGYLTNEAVNKGDETKSFYLTKIDSTTIKNY